MGSAETLEVLKFGLEFVCAAGAAYGFVVARDDWRQSQRWRKSEELEKMIERFESDPKCTLALTLLDWTDRTTVYGGAPFVVTRDAALEALALHDVDEASPYSAEAATLREALDALLAFLVRLEGALDREFIEVEHAKPHFEYWLKRLVTFDRHPDVERKAALRVARYIQHYSDVKAIAHLCEQFAIEAPELRKIGASKPELLARGTPKPDPKA